MVYMPPVSESTGEHRGENLNSYAACPEMWALKGCERVRNHDFQQTLHISLTHTKVGQALVLTSQQAILCPTNSTANGARLVLFQYTAEEIEVRKWTIACQTAESTCLSVLVNVNLSYNYATTHNLEHGGNVTQFTYLFSDYQNNMCLFQEIHRSTKKLTKQTLFHHSDIITCFYISCYTYFCKVKIKPYPNTL